MEAHQLHKGRWPFNGAAVELGFLPIQTDVIVSNRFAKVAWAEVEVPSSFPIPIDVTETVNNTLSTSHVFNRPSTLVAGNLWIAIITFSDNTSTAMLITDPPLWPRLNYTQSSSIHFLALVHEVTGGESVTFTVTTEIPCKSICQIRRYSNWADTGTILNDIEIAVSTVIGGSAGAREYNPPALDPVNWGTEPTGWLAGVTVIGNSFVSKLSDPTNYTDLADTFNDNITPRLQTHTLTRNLEAATENPDPFIFDNNNPGVSFTIAIRPGGTAAPPDPRRGQSSWAELEIPPAPSRMARVTWAELEAPDFAKRAQVSWAELEVPTNDRRGQIIWSELETPEFTKRAQVSYAELEVPSVVVPVTQLQLFTLLAELEVALEVSLVNSPGSQPWLTSGTAWFYNLGSRTVVDGVRREVTSVTVAGVPELTMADSVQDCRNIDGTWSSHPGQNEVYVNPWGTTNPNESISLIRFKLYFSNYAINHEGNYYEPRILLSQSDLNIRMTTNELMQGVSLLEGQIRLANGDALIDTLLKDYVLIGQRITLKVLKGVALNIGTKIVGEIIRTDSVVTLKLWS